MNIVLAKFILLLLTKTCDLTTVVQYLGSSCINFVAANLGMNLSKGTNGGYSVKRPSAFAGIGRTRDRITEDLRFINIID